MSGSASYITMGRLEALTLIAPQRFPGGKKVRRCRVTPKGTEAGVADGSRAR